MTLALYQFPTDFPYIPTMFSVFMNESYLVRNDFPNIAQPIAEQGFIAFIDDFDSCPLEFLCKNKPFKISQESQILHIKSNYFDNQTRKNPCQWKFAAPEGYGFKIVILLLDISATTSFVIENSTDVITNERSVKTKHPYYNSDSFIQIYMSEGDPNYHQSYIEFQAYISIIKNLQEKTTDSCKTSFDPVLKNIIWSNINNTKGYDNNVQCVYKLIIPPKGVVFISMDDYLEEDVDFVTYSENKNNIRRIYHSGINFGFTIDNFEGDFNKNVIFEFVSDGSVHAVGFVITFEFIDCKCSHKVAECDANYYLMDLHGPINKAYYCGNLNCNITIGKCETPISYIKFYTKTFVSTNDIFRVISNNQTVFEIVDFNQDSHFIYLNSSSENILQIITFPSSEINTLYFFLEKFEDPEEMKIIFSEENTTAIIDTAINPFTTVETELKNQFFMLYCPYPNLIGLFEDTSLATPIKYCFAGENPNICVVKKNRVVIYSSPELASTYVAIKLSKSRSNCVFGETNYFTNNLSNVSIASLSNKNGSCFITVFVDDYYFVTKLWTTSKMENVKVFVGIDQTKLYFEFNYNTGIQWKNILLNSAIYRILIPAMSGVYITLEKQQCSHGEQFIKIAEYGYKSLVTSPDYGCINRLFVEYRGSVVDYYIENYPVKFTVIDSDLSAWDLFYFQINDQHIFVNKTGDYFIVYNQHVYVSLYYTSIIFSIKNGILLLIETYDETDAKEIF